MTPGKEHDDSSFNLEMSEWGGERHATAARGVSREGIALVKRLGHNITSPGWVARFPVAGIFFSG